MLTILSYIIFWPALIWNFAFFVTVMARGGFNRRTLRADITATIISLAMLLIPGVYLFGVY